MRRRRWPEHVMGWLVFLFPFVAVTAPAWLAPEWLGLSLVLMGVAVLFSFALGNLWLMWRLVSRCRRPIAPRLWILGGRDVRC